MKRTWRTGATALLLAGSFFLAGCGSSDDNILESEKSPSTESMTAPIFAAGSTMETLQKAGKITIGVKVDQPGFGQNNPTTSKPEGFDIEIAKLVAQGIFGGTKDEAFKKIEFLEAKSKDREPFIQQNKVNLVIATYTINDTRKASVDFAGPYYTAHGDLLVKSSNTDIKSINDLAGKTVCVVQGSTYPATLTTKAPKATQLALADYSSCEQAVVDGRAQAMATDGPILIGLVSKSNGAEKVLNTNYTDEPYGVGLKKGDEAFRTFVNDRLQTIYDNGEWKAAFENTLGKLGVETPTPPTLDRYTAK